MFRAEITSKASVAANRYGGSANPPSNLGSSDVDIFMDRQQGFTPNPIKDNKALYQKRI